MTLSSLHNSHCFKTEFEAPSKIKLDNNMVAINQLVPINDSLKYPQKKPKI